MRFIILTNPSTNNELIEELVKSGLYPEFVVTETPFFVKKKNIFYQLLKKIQLGYRLLSNYPYKKSWFKPYFDARKYGIPVFDSYYINSNEMALKIKEFKIDYAFTFGFKILQENIIQAPLKGCINFHPALLPNNRGATPTNWVIRDNNTKTGITFHEITKGIDKGIIIEQYPISISGLENTKLLNCFLFKLGESLLVKLIYKLINEVPLPLKKNDVFEGSYQKPFKNEDKKITENLTIDEISQVIRASNDGFTLASFNYDNKKFNVINFIELPSISNDIKTPVFKEKNIIIKSKDKKYVLLILSAEK